MRWIAINLFIAFLPFPLRAEDAANPLGISLISENRSIAAGSEFYLGLKLSHPDGYHTYWKHPGIVGIPTGIEWELPEGFKAGEIEWPAPKRVKMAIYDAQGYHGETLLMIPVKTPHRFLGSAVTLSAKVSWMCCGSSCHPASRVPFSITLPVESNAIPNPETAEIFKTFRAQIARPDESWQTTIDSAGATKVLRLKKQQNAPLVNLSSLGEVHFFTEDGQIDSNEKQVVSQQAEGMIEMRLSGSASGPTNARSLPGLLFASKGWGAPGPPFYIRIDPSY